jgi:hypothetical protein
MVVSEEPQVVLHERQHDEMHLHDKEEDTCSQGAWKVCGKRNRFTGKAKTAGESEPNASRKPAERKKTRTNTDSDASE